MIAEQINSQTRSILPTLAGLFWGYTVSQFGLLDNTPVLGVFAIAASSIALVFYGTRIWKSVNINKDIINKNNKLLQIEKGVNQHCLISVADEHRKLIDVNDGLLEAIGYSREEMIGHDPIDFQAVAPPSQSDEILRYMNESKVWRGEIPLRHRDGTILWTQSTICPMYNESGSFVGSTSIRTDISATKVALAEKEAMAILSKFPDSVYIIEPQTSSFIYMNEVAMRRHGWDRKTYRCKTLTDTFSSFDPSRFSQLVAPLLDGSKTEVITRAVLLDGPTEIRIRLIKKGNGPERLVAILKNISEQLEVEKFKDQFIASVSHELRSPLTSIKGALGLLVSGAVSPLPPKAEELVKIAYRNSDRLAHLVNDILDLEKIGAGQMEFEFGIFDLNNLVAEAIELNAGIAEDASVNFRFDQLDEPALSRVDSSRFQQVLTNLITNATKFSFIGSEVLLSLHREGTRLRVDVSDYGVGIPQDDLKKIFDRFHQARNQAVNKSPGSGLGLSIVKAILTEHGGDIRVKSEVGKGSTFSVYVPYVEPSAVELAVA